jgi:myosin-9
VLSTAYSHVREVSLIIQKINFGFWQVAEMREKNLDLMRQDIVGVLKNSSMAFVRELVGADPVAVFRWAIVRAFFRGYFAFHEAGRRHRLCRGEMSLNPLKPSGNFMYYTV